MNLGDKDPLYLLNLYSTILKELKRKGVVRTNNAPISDYAEWLVKEKLNLELENNSKKGYDCVDAKGLRYQVKCRRCVENKRTQLGVIRNYYQNEFDYLIGIIFNEDFSVQYAYKIPHKIIQKYSKFSKHQNGMILQLKGEVLKDSLAIDITEMLK